MANAFINLLPLESVKRPNVGETFARSYTAARQNALTSEKIKGEQAENALNRTKQKYLEMAPEMAEWDTRWESALEASGGDREKALAQIQPEWDAYVPPAKQKGYPVTDTFNPESIKSFLDIMRRNKIIGGKADNLSQTTLADQEGNPLVYDKSTGTYRRGIVESGVKARPRQRPSKPTQTEKDRKLLRQEANKLFPDANFTEGEILIAGKNAQATGRSLEYELRKILKKRSPEAEPEKAEEPEKEPWYSRFLGGGKKKEQPAAEKPPEGAVDTGRTSGGKPVWKLPSGDYWLQSQAAPVNLAMKAENVPLGTGMADQAQNLFTLQKQYQEALRNGDFETAERVKRQMQNLRKSRQNVG